MSQYKYICPCCGEEIIIDVDQAELVVQSDFAYIESNQSELLESFGIEFGSAKTRGGEDDGQVDTIL